MWIFFSPSFISKRHLGTREKRQRVQDFFQRECTWRQAPERRAASSESQRLKLSAGVGALRPCILVGRRHTFGSGFLGIQRTFLPTLLTSLPPVLIKFCLGKDNENIILHSLIILPDEIMQSRNVLRETGLDAEATIKCWLLWSTAPGADVRGTQELRIPPTAPL